MERIAPSSIIEQRPTPQQIAEYEAAYGKWVEANWATIQRNAELKKQGLPPLPLPEPPHDPRVKNPYIKYALPNTEIDAHPPADKPFTFDSAGRVRAWMDGLKQKRDQDWDEAVNPPDRFVGHTISEDGVREHDAYAANLVRDTNPDETARYLKNVITWSGDQGRGDVADLLGRFAKVDQAKARTLQDALHRATGERIPFRVAPLGKGFVEQESLDSESIQMPERNPFGSGAGIDPWEAANMADALAKKSSYEGGPLDYFKGEFAKDRKGALTYTAAVYDALAGKSPKQAAKFAEQMKAADLTADAPDGPQPDGSIRITIPPPPQPEQAPVGSGTNTTGQGLDPNAPQGPDWARFQTHLDDVFENEGGYSDNKNDAGGRTKYGITETTLGRVVN